MGEILLSRGQGFRKNFARTLMEIFVQILGVKQS
jgi:hypothetical protein